MYPVEDHERAIVGHVEDQGEGSGAIGWTAVVALAALLMWVLA